MKYQGQFLPSQKEIVQAGFTLIEMLLVLLIVGIFIGVLVPTLNRNNAGPQDEAERFGQLLSLALEEAVLQSQEYAVSLSRDGYFFSRFSQGKWVPLSESDIFRERMIPESIKRTLFLENHSIESFPLRDNRERANIDQYPTIYLFSNGEMTSFSLVFQTQKDTLQVVVSGNMIGEINLETN